MLQLSATGKYDPREGLARLGAKCDPRGMDCLTYSWEAGDETEFSRRGPRTDAITGVWDFLRDDSGQDLIEYALVAALIALAAIASMKGLATKISNAFNTIGTSLTGDV